MNEKNLLMTEDSKIVLIGGRSCPNLLASLAEELHIKPFSIKLEKFANSEINVEFLESVRGKNVYILQTGQAIYEQSVNDYLIELLLIISGCKKSDANSINVIIPHLPYARSDKKDHRGPIGAKTIIDLIVTSGANRIISVDLHSGQLTGFTGSPIDNLYCLDILSDHLSSIIVTESSSLEEYVLVSPDLGGVKRIEAYARKLNLPYVILHKQRDYSKMNTVINSMIIGENKILENKIAIIIDDMIDTCSTMIKGIMELKTTGKIKSAIVVATHGIFSSHAIELINSCEIITSVIVTDSLNQEINLEKCPKLQVISLVPLLYQVIKILTEGGSLSALFEKKLPKRIISMENLYKSINL